MSMQIDISNSYIPAIIEIILAKLN